MENNTELGRLEEYVEKLLKNYTQLKAEYHNLQETLRQRDAECADLKTKVFELSTERSEVGNKVAGLLDRIEQWEHEQSGAPAAPQEGNGPQEKLFGQDV